MNLSADDYAALRQLAETADTGVPYEPIVHTPTMLGASWIWNPRFNRPEVSLRGRTLLALLADIDQLETDLAGYDAARQRVRDLERELADWRAPLEAQIEKLNARITEMNLAEMKRMSQS